MRRRLALWGVAALTLAAVPPAAAQDGGAPPGAPPPPPAEPPPSPDRITILTVFKTIEFGQATFLSGRFRRLENPEAEAEPYAGREVTLESAPFPFSTFTPVATATTDREGYYNFRADPRLATRYRVVAADPVVSSDAKIVRVRLRPTLEISDTTPERGDRVTFSGEVLPPNDGARVEIRERNRGTVARTVLRDAGEERSQFRVSVKLNRDGFFFARVLGNELNLPGVTEGQAIDVQKPKPKRKRRGRRGR